MSLIKHNLAHINTAADKLHWAVWDMKQNFEHCNKLRQTAEYLNAVNDNMIFFLS